MPDMDRIYAAITRATRDANQRLPADKRIEDSRDAVILGDPAKLDSLGLINLLVAVEQEIETEFDTQINLVNDVEELAERAAAFQTVSTLAGQVSILLDEARTTA